MKIPNPDNINSSGFDDYLSGKKIAKAKKIGSDAGFTGNRWPKAAEVAEAMQKTGSADVTRSPIQFLDPAYHDPLLFFIQHRDRRELNFRLRHAYEYDPIVGNLIDLHRTMPLSDYHLVCRDKTIEGEFHSFADDIELLNMSSYILGDYFLLGECWPAGTPVLMHDGAEKPIETIRAGDFVISHTGNAQKVMYPTTKNITDETMYKIIVNGQGQFSSFSTENHPVLIVKREDHPCVLGMFTGGRPRPCIIEAPCKVTATSYYKDNGVKYGKHLIKYGCKHWPGTPTPEFVPAKDVKVGDYVVIPRIKSPDVESSKENKSYARLLGYYLSEGCLGMSRDKSHLSNINLANTDDVLLADMKKVLSMHANGATLRDYKSKIVTDDIIKHRKLCHHLVLWNRTLAERVLVDGGKYSDKKKLSAEVMTWPRDLKIEMLKGFILGDGWIDEGAVRMATVSSDLASQFYTMLTELGCDVSIRSRECFAPRTNIRCKDIYYLKLSKASSQIFKESLGKLNQIREPRRKATYTRIYDDFILKPITKIEKKVFSGQVYNLEVEQDHSYIANKFAVHNCVMYKTWDSYNKTWKELTLLPPEKVEMRKTYLTKQPLMLLHVDSELKRLVNSADPVDKAIAEMMDPDLIDKIKTQDRIPLSPSQACLFANKTSESDLRGTSPLKRALYALLLKYKLRLLHSTYLDRGTFPLKIFKLGDASSKWIPNQSHFTAFRNMLAAAANDSDFSIIWHFGLQVEILGSKDKWENLLPHYEFCDKEIMAALFGNESLINSKGSTYSNSNVSVRVLMSRYQMIRSQLELLWKNQIFKTMAEARDYWVPDRTGNTGNLPTKWRNGKSYYLDIPNFKWAKINLLDDVAQKQFLMRLREKLEVPHKAVMEAMDLDHDEVVQQLKAEEGTLVDPIAIEARKKASALPTVMSQVIQGRKSSEWVLPAQLPEDAAKSVKDKKQDLGTGPDSAGAGPMPGGPKPNMAVNPPGIAPPGDARTAPMGAPTGHGTPAPTLPTSPDQGSITQPPL